MTDNQETSFRELIQGSERPVLVDFYADWCGPCKTLAGELEKFADEHGQEVKIVKVNVDNNMSAALSCKVRGVPTLVLYKEGQEIWRNSGTMSLQGLKKEVLPLLNNES